MNELLAQQGQTPTAAADNIPSFDFTPSSSVEGRESPSSASPDEGDSPSGSREGEERDFEMENELVEELDRGDAFSDYDIDDVTKEGEALNEYLALLDSAMNGGK